jgi:hypothetical protein
MAGKPIETVITTDVDGVIKGAEKVADSFEDIQDSLKDTGKAGDKAFEQLEDSAGDAAKVIDRDLTKALAEVEDKAQSTGRTIGKNVKSGTDKAGEGMSELRDESKSTAKEAAASFGSIEDAADAVQEVVANAFVGFGPAGLAAGIVAAAGIGLAISALTENAEKIAENKERMAELATEIYEVGGDLALVDFADRMQEWGLAIQDTKEFWEVWQKDAKNGFDVIQEESKKAGTQWVSAFKGAHGTMEDSQKFLQDTQKDFEELTKSVDDAGVSYDSYGNAISNANIEDEKRLEALKKQRDAAQKNNDEIRKAIAAARDLEAVNGKSAEALAKHAEEVEKNAKAEAERLRFVKDTPEALQYATEKTEEANEAEAERRGYIDGTTEALRRNLDIQEKVTDALKGAITYELDYLDSAADLTTKLTESSYAWDINTKAGRDNQRAVIDIANGIEDMAKAQIDAGGNVDDVTAKFNTQKDALINQVAPAFGGSKEAARQYIEQILKTPTAVNTKVALTGIPQAEEEVRAFTDKGRHLLVNIKTGDTSSVDNYIRTNTGKTLYMDFAPRGGVAATN